MCILVETWNWTMPTVHGRAPFTWPICLFRQWQILRYLHPLWLVEISRLESVLWHHCYEFGYQCLQSMVCTAPSLSHHPHHHQHTNEWVSSNQQTFFQHHHHYFECFYGLWLSDISTITHENWRCSFIHVESNYNHVHPRNEGLWSSFGLMKSPKWSIPCAN